MAVPTFSIQPTRCTECGHQHGGAEVAFICIGCPCPETPGRVDELIAKSSIGAGLRDIEERGIDAHLADIEQEMAPKKKRKSSTSPTQRTLAECKKRGWTAGVVERWIPRVNKRIDLFGVIDLMAIVPGETGLVVGGILGIQACRDGDHATHRTKILAEPKALEWVKAGGRLELWSWGKRGDRGKRKLWTLRVEAFTVEDWPKPSIDDLIARSSIGQGLRDIEERGIDAHLKDLEREMRPRRRKAT